MSERRPQNFHSCPGSVDENAMVMDALVEVSYNMETNRPALSDEERDLALGYLREDMLQSLINMHCPKQGLRNRDRLVGSRAEARSSSGLKALSVHASAPRWQDSSCPMTHGDTLSCHKFSNDILMLFDADTTKNYESNTTAFFPSLMSLLMR